VVLDRFGVKRIGRIGSFVWSVASFASAAALGVRSFFAARLLLGIGEAPTFPGNAKATGYWFPRRERALATAIFDSAAKFAPAIGVPVLGLFLIRFGWRMSFAATGIASFIYFLFFWRFYCDPSDDHRLSAEERRYIVEGGAQPEDAKASSNAGAPLGYLLRQRKVIGVSLGFAAYNYTFYLLLTWMPSYLSMTMNIDLKQSVLYSILPWLVATATDLLVGGWLIDALILRGWNGSAVRRAVLIVGMAFGVGMFPLAVAHTPQAAVFWMSVALGGLAATAPVAWSIPSLIAPRESVGRMGGILNFWSQVAAIAAPIVTGHVVDLTHSFKAAFVIAAVLLVLGIGGYAFLLGKIEPVPEPN
jgi:MFS family permease